MSTDREHDAHMVRQVLRSELKVHVRIRDQKNAPTEAQLRKLVDALPDVIAFGENSFHGVRAVLDWNGDLGRTVFLAGTARSGTTWLSELINHRNDYRYIFERVDALGWDVALGAEYKPGDSTEGSLAWLKGA